MSVDVSLTVQGNYTCFNLSAAATAFAEIFGLTAQQIGVKPNAKSATFFVVTATFLTANATSLKDSDAVLHNSGGQLQTAMNNCGNFSATNEASVYGVGLELTDQASALPSLSLLAILLCAGLLIIIGA